MNVQRQTVTIVTAANGTATAYTERAVTGRILTLIYQKVNYANGVDFAITLETTGQGLWTENNVNASATRCPRQPTHDAVGAPSFYAGGGGEPVEDYIYADNERVKFIISEGGDTKSGTFQVLVG